VSRFTRVAAITTIAALVSLTPALAAHAVGTRALGAGESLYAFAGNGWGGSGSTEFGKMYSLSVADATSTLVGPNTVASTGLYPSSAAYDAETGAIYWVESDFNNGTPCYLTHADPATGTSTRVAQIMTSNGAAYCNAIAIGDNHNGYMWNGSVLYALDLDTALATRVTPQNVNNGIDTVWSFAFNPADSEFYAVGNSNNNALFQIDVNAGTVTELVPHADMPTYGTANSKRLYGITFDSNGVMWGINADTELFSALVSNAGADISSTIEEVGSVMSIEPYALAAVPAAEESVESGAGEEAENNALAETGAGETAAIGTLAALLLVSASIAAMLRRRSVS
jgi:hypothetical protein